MGDEWTIDSEQAKMYFLQHFEKQWAEHKHLKIKMRTGKQRTLTQNAAMHKYFELLANALNDAGYTVAKVLTKPIEMSWTPSLVKDLLWRRIQDAVVNKLSTKQLERVECSIVYDELNKIMIENYGVTVAWPSQEE